MSLSIEISRDGYKVLQIHRNNKKIYLGSKFNQKREIDKFIKRLGEFTNKDNFIILGLSFGEHIKELLKLIHKDSKILIVEFDHELIEFCKKDEETKKIINNEKVIIADDISKVEAFIETYVNEMNIEKLRIVTYGNYDKVYMEESKEVYTLVRNNYAKIKINRNTFDVFGEVFLENLFSNLKYVSKSTDINELENTYKNKPAVIVSAGPSLIKNIDMLKGVDNALILSGGRTLAALVERNIKPSCIGVVDPGDVSYKLVEPYIKDVTCPLIYSDLCNEKIIKEHNANKFFYTDIKLLWKVFGKKIKHLYGGGSIAHTLLNLAIYMGCSPIIFIGQDLAYTGDRGHAVCSGNRWNEWTFDIYKQPTDLYVDDIYGDKVRTSLLLNEYRLDIEKIIKECPNPDIKFINATEGGANIEGAENRELQEVLNELKKEAVIPMGKFSKTIDKTEDIIKELESNLELVKEYIKLCKNGKKYLKNYKMSYLLKNQKGVDDSVKKLDKIDKEIMIKNLEIDLISTIITKVVYAVENDEKFLVKSSDGKKKIFDKEADRSERLYSQMQEALEKCYKSIEKTIEELKKER